MPYTGVCACAPARTVNCGTTCRTLAINPTMPMELRLLPGRVGQQVVVGAQCGERDAGEHAQAHRLVFARFVFAPRGVQHDHAALIDGVHATRQFVGVQGAHHVFVGARARPFDIAQSRPFDVAQESLRQAQPVR